MHRVDEADANLEGTGKFANLLGNNYGLNNNTSLPDIRNPSDYNSSQKEYQRIKKLGGQATQALRQNYNEKVNKYEIERQAPTFKNGSRNVKSLLSLNDDGGDDAYYPSKEEQFAQIERKMAKINHLLD